MNKQKTNEISNQTKQTELNARTHDARTHTHTKTNQLNKTSSDDSRILFGCHSKPKRCCGTGYQSHLEQGFEVFFFINYLMMSLAISCKYLPFFSLGNRARHLEAGALRIQTLSRSWKSTSKEKLLSPGWPRRGFTSRQATGSHTTL